jgi:hypothetical protein
MGLIATNTIAQGDTRSTGLRWICLNGGTIVAARKRYRWPGVAAVVVSIVHVLKGAYSGERTLDGRRAEQITAFLFDKGGHEDPKPLKANAGQSFVGSYVLGMGFTFDDSGEADDDTPGIPSPIATMERLIAENPRNAEVIFPYIGGKEVNDSPTHAHHRYVINFGDRSEEECRRGWPELMGIVERKVKAERDQLKDNADGRRRKQFWWQFGRSTPALDRAIESQECVFAISQVFAQFGIAILPKGLIYAHRLIVFASESMAWWAVLQSTLHETWTEFLSYSLEERRCYAPSDCLENFPSISFLLDNASIDSASDFQRLTLESIGARYHQFRSELMLANNEGLTTTYNRFHDPAETCEGIVELRRLHLRMDQSVLQVYGWDDIPASFGFGLDYLDTHDDSLLPPDLQDRIDSGDLFFPTASEACSFQAQLRRYGAVKASRRLAWRHRWPDAVRDDVLARLLALNAERYAEEEAQGLYGKGGKKPAAAPTASGKRRGRPTKATESVDTEQIGLAL